jgi:hypothetical protein
MMPAKAIRYFSLHEIHQMTRLPLRHLRYLLDAHLVPLKEITARKRQSLSGPPSRHLPWLGVLQLMLAHRLRALGLPLNEVQRLVAAKTPDLQSRASVIRGHVGDFITVQVDLTDIYQQLEHFDNK